MSSQSAERGCDRGAVGAVPASTLTAKTQRSLTASEEEMRVGGALEEGSKTSSQRLLRHAGHVTAAGRGGTALLPRTPSPEPRLVVWSKRSTWAG